MASDPRCTCLNCGYGMVSDGRDRHYLADWSSHPYSNEKWLRLLAIRYALVERAWMARLHKPGAQDGGTN